jgi:hypothetical protein
MADQPSPRRRFQFSLRTLFVIVTLGTLVGAICAAVTWAVGERERLVRERDEARSAATAASQKSADLMSQLDRALQNQTAARQAAEERAARAERLLKDSHAFP